MANDNQNQNPQHTYEGKSYGTLDEAILAAAKQSCSGVTSWHRDDPFYPSRDDLTGLVLVKLCTVQPQLESIWNDPDPDTGGYVGLLRFAWKVAKRAAIDEKRRNTSRAPEILAVRLDEPIRNQDGGTDTQADLIPDADGTFQAFQFDDLRDQLSEQEYAVLHGSVANGATQQELAEEIGTSDSAISRTYTRAKAKAAKWIRWLKDRTDRQVRANVHPTFTRRPCLRPNGIAQETLERWSDALTVVQFHDESGEWHPPITKQPRERARRECWNLACAGIAVGADNLILPAAQRNEAVRFLPTHTGQDNRLCEGCEKAAKRADTISIETTTEQQPHFFSPSAINETSDATQGIRMQSTDLMDHKQAAEIIKEFNIPRSIVARLSGLHLPDLSAWLNGKQDISDDKRERVSQWVADVAKMIQAMATLSIKVDLSDVENVRHLVQKINDAEMQMDLALDSPLRMKPMPGETGAAA